MDKNKILSSSYLDLIFDGRNKAYGSYELRKSYPYRMRRAAAFLLMTACIALGYKVMGERSTPKAELPFPELPNVVKLGDIKPILPEKPIPVPEKPAAPAAPVKTIAFPPPDIVEDNNVSQNIASQKDLQHAVAAKITADGDSMGLESPDIIDPKGSGTGRRLEVDNSGGRGNFSPKIEVFVEQQPEFPGGQEQLYQYLRDHLKYPEPAANAGQQGKVQVKFVVNEDGSISNITALRGFGYGSEQEAIRVVSSMPRWKPGRNNGIAVKVWFNLPINFVMGN